MKSRTEAACLRDALDAEYSRIMREQQAFAVKHRARIEADWNALPDNPLTAKRHVADVRASIGEKRWAELNREWEQSK